MRLWMRSTPVGASKRDARRAYTTLCSSDRIDTLAAQGPTGDQDLDPVMVVLAAQGAPTPPSPHQVFPAAPFCSRNLRREPALASSQDPCPPQELMRGGIE